MINLDGSTDWVPENMALDNNDVKSINSPLIILSLSRDGTAGSDTGEFWVALNGGSVVAVYRLAVVLIHGLTVLGGLSETSDNTSADSSFGGGP